MNLTLEAYAALLAELTLGREPREAILARWALDEASWEAIDREMQAVLDVEAAEGEDVPEPVRRFSSAFETALGEATTAEMPFEAYRVLTHRFRRGEDAAALAQSGLLDLGRYLRAHRYWVKAMLADDTLRRRFEDD